jgi:crossover junction endodeoxyribonuclease RusA
VRHDKVTGKSRAVVTAANARTKGWQGTIRAEALKHFFPRFEGAVQVDCEFRMPRPLSHHVAASPLKPVRPDAPAWPAGKPDVDKLVRTVLDALTGVSYADDSQVVRVVGRKVYASRGADGIPLAGVTVRVEAVG